MKGGEEERGRGSEGERGKGEGKRVREHFDETCPIPVPHNSRIPLPKLL